MREEAVDSVKSKSGYKEAIEELQVWMELRNFGAPEDYVENKGFAFGEILIDRRQHLWDDEQPQAKASTLLSAIHEKWPRLKAEKATAGAWRALKAWSGLEPSEFRLPWPVELLYTLIAISFLCGKIAFGLVFWVMFHGCARRRRSCDLF